MEPGIKGQAAVEVTKENTAASVDSGLLEVFATPSMVALMEKAAADSVAPFLEQGNATVGTRLEISHLRATPIGDSVTARSVLESVEGRKLVFSVTASDSKGIVGEGKHERFIIDAERFMKKATGC